MSNRILLQHGINLLNVGIQTMIGVWAISSGNRYMWLICLPGWMFDYGYFIAIDLVEGGNLLGELQTYIISTGMICSGLHTMELFEDDVGDWEGRMMLFVPCLLMVAGIINKLSFVTGARKKPIEEAEK